MAASVQAVSEECIVKKTVLFRVTNNLNRAGIQNRLCTVLPVLAQEYGYEVHVVTYRDRGVLADKLESRGVQVHHIPIRHKWSPLGIWRLSRLFRKYKADIVHGHSFGGTITGILAGALAKVPVRVGQCHTRDLHWYGKTPVIRKAQARKEAWVHQHFGSHEFCVSEGCRTHFIQETGLSEAYVSVLHNGIDLSRFHEGLNRETGRAALGVEQDQVVVGFMGRLNKSKGLDFLFNHVHTLGSQGKKYVFLIAGSGSEDIAKFCRAEAKAIRSENGPEIRLMGEVTAPETFYPALDLFFFPSEPGVEGFPNVLLEAAACGLPILMRKTETVSEFSHYYSRFYAMDEDEDFHNALTTALSLPRSDQERLREEFSLEAMARRTHDAYTALAIKRNLR